MSTMIFSKKEIGNYFKSNKKRYLICALFLVLGTALGVILALKNPENIKIYQKDSLSLESLITGDYKWFSLFIEDIGRLFLSLSIIFLLSIKPYTFCLAFAYIAFQGYLMGASITSIVALNGVRGVLSTIFVIFPINLINFACIFSAFTIFWDRKEYAKRYKLSTKKSMQAYLPKLALIGIMVVLSALLCSVAYPLLIRSNIIVNY